MAGIDSETGGLSEEEERQEAMGRSLRDIGSDATNRCDEAGLDQGLSNEERVAELLRQSEDKAQHIRIVLIGRTGVEKVETANTLMGGPKMLKTRVDWPTKECESDVCIHGSISYKFIDMPGFIDEGKDKRTICEGVANCLQFAAPGPHIFLIVLQTGQFTKKDRAVIAQTEHLFGKEFAKNHGVVFTRSDDVKSNLPEDDDGIATEDRDLSDQIEMFLRKQSAKKRGVFGFTRSDGAKWNILEDYSSGYVQGCKTQMREEWEKVEALNKLRDDCSSRIFNIDNNLNSKGREAEAARFYESIHEWGLGKRYCIDNYRLAETMENDKRVRNEELAKEELLRKKLAEKEQLKQVRVEDKERLQEFEDKRTEMENQMKAIEGLNEEERKRLLRQQEELDRQIEEERLAKIKREQEEQQLQVESKKHQEEMEQRIGEIEGNKQKGRENRQDDENRLRKEYKETQTKENEKYYAASRNRENECKRKEVELEEKFKAKVLEPVRPNLEVIDKIWDGIREAAKSVGISSGSIFVR